jgi:hypothetical protein
MDAPYAVQLVVPALADSARLARLVAASLATDAGWTLDDTEDLRIAVSEMVALLVEGSEHAEQQVELTYHRLPDAVEVEGQRRLDHQTDGPVNPVNPATSIAEADELPADGPTVGTDTAAAPDDLALEILRVVVDEHQYTEDPSGRWFRLLKHPRKHP